jgi:hypothetical protein
MTLDEIVTDYIREYHDIAGAEMRFFEIQRSAPGKVPRSLLCRFMFSGLRPV